MAKKLFYSMGEVSEMFDVNASLIRHWESKFDVLRPRKNKKGNRMFSPGDVENLKLIYHLVKERGMTLEGANRCLKRNRGALTRDAELLERLQRVRCWWRCAKSSVPTTTRRSLPTSRMPLPSGRMLSAKQRLSMLPLQTFLLTTLLLPTLLQPILP